MFKEETGTIIGSDEALKGDTFGGIVVAAVKANDEQRKKLIEFGATDSKTLTDHQVMLRAERIENYATCEIKNIYPEEYNNFKGSQTELLNTLHKKLYDDLKPGKHIVDQFPGCTVGDIIETQADANYVEVAAASILARAYALKQLQDISERAGFIVPKGSSHVEDALKKLKQHHTHYSNLVKLNFKNVKNILEL